MKWLVFLMSTNLIANITASSFIVEVPEEKQKVISELVTTMGGHSTLALGFKKTHLEGLGKELRGVGPLQFLAYVFSDKALQKHMRSIKSSSFKWNAFVKGIAPGLKRDLANGSLLRDLPAFSQFMSVPYEPLEKAAKDQNWDLFVSTVLEHKK